MYIKHSKYYAVAIDLNTTKNVNGALEKKLNLKSEFFLKLFVRQDIC